MAQSLIDINLREKRFHDKTVLGQIQFKMSLGERLTLFGPSGCGKTTLLRMIAGLDRQIHGQFSGLDSRIGFVFQEPRLLPWKTVQENIELVAPNQPDLISDLLEQVGLIEAAHEVAAKLSLGMARRVALARALAIKPDLLILDEPFASLDQQRALTLRALVLELIERHQTSLLLVTHDPEEAIQLTQRVLVLGGTPSVIENTFVVSLTETSRLDKALVQKETNRFCSSIFQLTGT